VEHGVVRVLVPQRADVRAVEERAGPALARVPERPQALAIGRGHRHLDRVRNAVVPARRLDQADRALDGAGRVVLQPEGQRQEEQQLGVCRSFDLGVEVGVDRQREVTLDRGEVPEEPVVHPQPAAAPEGMAVRLLDRGAAGGADVREDQPGGHVRGQLTQVAVVPGGFGAVEDAGRRRGAVPADAEAVPVGGLRPQRRVEALHDQRVLGLVQQLVEQDRIAGVGEPAAHRGLLSRRAPRQFTAATGGGASPGQDDPASLSSAWGDVEGPTWR
jgi:hypothetical protein